MGAAGEYLSVKHYDPPGDIRIVRSFVVLAALVGAAMLMSCGGADDPTPTTVATATPSPSPSPTPTPSPTPEPEPVVRSLVIANTGGIGVRLRDGCNDENRIDGGLPEGAPVILVAEGIGECSDWQIVGFGEGGRTTWVREEYLSIATATPTPSPVSSCDSAYPTVCIPPPPPVLSCFDLEFSQFQVTGSDPHGFDEDNNGVGCES